MMLPGFAARSSSAFATAPAMPRAPGVRTTSAPYASVSLTRSVPHRVRHDDDGPVAEHRRERGVVPMPGVAAGGLDHHAAGGQDALGLGSAYHIQRDAVLGAARRVGALKLGRQAAPRGKMCKTHQRRRSL